jgi:hypothetical protein
VIRLEILTVKEVAKTLKASPAFVYAHYKDLGGLKIAGIVRFNKLDFENRIGGMSDNMQKAEDNNQ